MIDLITDMATGETKQVTLPDAVVLVAPVAPPTLDEVAASLQALQDQVQTLQTHAQLTDLSNG